MAPVIRTVELSRSFDGFQALDQLSIDVNQGEVLALLGPNGAGKTTTVRILNGLLTPDHGHAEVLGLDPAVDGHELRRRTGVLTENAGVDERFTALENLLFVARIRGMEPTEARRRAEALLDQFGLSHRSDALVQGFSTGQRKRIALARAMLHDPEVLFLDEPTSGLDPAATRDVIALIGQLASERGRTVILCTHFLGEAGRLANRVALLHRGRIQAFGTQAEIAAGIWTGLDAEIDLGGPAMPPLVAELGGLPGVQRAQATTTGVLVGLDGRNDMPGVVAHLVARGATVFGASLREPTLEDIYFAVAERFDVPSIVERTP